MTLAEDIYSVLSVDAGLVALVGTRVYPLRRPPKVVLPCVTYGTISDVPAETHAGYTMRAARVQFDCWADSMAGAQGLAAAVKAAVTGVGEAAIILGGFDDLEYETDTYHVAVDVEVYTKEA